MPLVECTLTTGRTPEQIRSLISALTSAVVEVGVAPKEAVRVIVREVPTEHFAAGDVTLAERRVAAAPAGNPPADTHPDASTSTTTDSTPTTKGGSR